MAGEGTRLTTGLLCCSLCFCQASAGAASSAFVPGPTTGCSGSCAFGDCGLSLLSIFSLLLDVAAETTHRRHGSGCGCAKKKDCENSPFSFCSCAFLRVINNPCQMKEKTRRSGLSSAVTWRSGRTQLPCTGPRVTATSRVRILPLPSYRGQPSGWLLFSIFGRSPMLTTSYQMTICVTWHRSSYNQPDRESRHISDRLFLARSRGYFHRAPCIFAPGLTSAHLYPHWHATEDANSAGNRFNVVQLLTVLQG